MRSFSAFDRYMGRLPRALIVAAAVAALSTVGAIDYLTGEDIGFSIFYVIPVMLMAWYLGRAAGIITSFLAAFTWYLADVLTGHVYANAAIPVWNAAIRLGFFLLIVVLMAIIKDALAHARELAMTDPLTGAFNARRFYGLADVEVERARRYGRPFSVAYMDLDNFKEVNDVYGHPVGDDLLCFVAGTIRDHVRKGDIVARLGGDEFVVLFPETRDGNAVSAVEKLKSLIAAGMPQYRFPVTLSVGMITYIMPPASVEDMVREVDSLMYAVKNSTKNAIRHETIGDEGDRRRMISGGLHRS